MTTADEGLREAIAKIFNDHGLSGSLFDKIIDQVSQTVPHLIDTVLVQQLHATERHPDYEYASVEATRKSVEHVKPERGEGWVLNEYRDGGVTRDNAVEYHHWRRRKMHRQNDPVYLHELPDVRVTRWDLAKLIGWLQERYNEHTIEGGTGFVGRKAEYIQSQRHLFGARGSELFMYSFSWDLGPDRRDEDFPFKVRDYNHPNASSKPYLVIDLAKRNQPFRILVDCADPYNNTWISVDNRSGLGGPWIQADTHTTLPIDLYELTQELENYGL